MRELEFSVLGDSGVVVRFGHCVNAVTHQKVLALSKYLKENPFSGMIECVPGYTSVSVFYDSTIVPFENLVHDLEDICAGLVCEDRKISRVVEIPVCYGDEFGPDLDYVAKYHGFSTDEVIDLHSQKEYLVYMLGFAPGFPYLGGMDERIATPRRDSPRLSIPVGSVGIGGQQTGIYPIECPGGWQLIGQTPVQLFQPHKHPPSLLHAGDVIRFRPVSRDEYDRLKGERAWVSR